VNIRRLVPGVILCIVIRLAGMVCQIIEQGLVGRAYIEGLVLAILLGVAVRAFWEGPALFAPGVSFSAKQLLEMAVCLIGVAIDTKMLLRAGPLLLVGILVIVAAGLTITYSIARIAGLHHRLAVLLAAGNSICGNSAIAAVAPVIGAEPDDIASAISFTAVLGVIVVLVLPLIIVPAGLTESQYGVVAGLTIYAVPQVLAATLPVGVTAGATATLVKLVRVLLLGPLVVGLGLASPRGKTRRRGSLVPWFIVGFIIIAGVRSLGLLSPAAVKAVRTAATSLTLVAMAALGLGVDLRALKKSSGRVITVVSLSLCFLCLVSIWLARSVGQIG
jgi:uncharacterized integral membrane protein (TIGR00698 family)